MKRVDSYLKNMEPKIDLGTQSNIRFYLAMYVACTTLDSANPTREQIAGIDLSKISDSTLAQYRDRVLERFGALDGDDQVAKGSKFVEALKVELQKLLAKEKGDP